MSQAFENGRRARREGKPASANPHHPWSSKSREWRDGYNFRPQCIGATA